MTGTRAPPSFPIFIIFSLLFLDAKNDTEHVTCEAKVTLSASWMFFRAFSSVVRQMPGYNSQRRGTARTVPKIFVSFYVLFVCKCVLYCCHRVATKLTRRNFEIKNTQLQLTNISYMVAGGVEV